VPCVFLLPGFTVGALELDPISFLSLAVGQRSTTEQTTFAIPVPSRLRGVSFRIQGVAGNVQGLRFPYPERITFR